MQKNIVATVICMATLTVAMPVFAESAAPVYDADAMQDQFDNAGNDPAQQDVPPPAPGQEAAAFVPVQPEVAPPPPPPSSARAVEKHPKHVEQEAMPSPSTESLAKVDSLQEELQSLRGQVEQLNHQLQQMQDQQKTLPPNKKSLAPGMSVESGTDNNASPADAAASAAVSDNPPTKPTKTPVSNKTAKGPSASAIAASAAAEVAAPPKTDDAAPKSGTDQPNVAEEQQIYQTAYNLIKAKKYSEAVDALQSMLKKYPSGQFASNAHYWLGELYGLMNKNDSALTEFTLVVSKYPNSPRISDAQLKVGLIYAAESNWSEAKTAFKKVINHYPGTASAQVASEQLKMIKQAGN